jgi:uncharacterized protein (TIGR02246 family)
MSSGVLGVDKSKDEQAIRALEAAYDAAWRRGDIDTLMACFAPDAVLVNPLGQVVDGREEIGRMLRAFLAGPARDSKHTTRIVRLSFITDDVAVVDGKAILEDAAVEESVLQHRFTDIFVKRDGRWLISQVRAYRQQ